MQALSINNLTKVYPGGFKALDSISFAVKQGDFFALLGPNGAGKSTTINIITTLVKKTQGEVSLFGHDIDKALNVAKSHVGVVPQEFNFSIFEKPFDILVQQAGYYGVPAREAKQRAEQLLKQLELWDKRDVQSKALSGGMKRRLMIARAMVHHPKLLILDEPTAGVDIEIRHSMWEFLTELNRSGTTIILTTHYLEEAQKLCRNIAIINHGKILKNGSMNSLLGELENEYYILTLNSTCSLSSAQCEQLQSFNLDDLGDNRIGVCVNKREGLNPLFAKLTELGLIVSAVNPRNNPLEQLFLDIVQGDKS